MRVGNWGRIHKIIMSSSPPKVGGFSQPRPPTKDDTSKLQTVWHDATKRNQGLGADFSQAKITAVSSQVVNGENLAYTVETSGGAKHRIVVYFPGSWNEDNKPQVTSVEKL